MKLALALISVVFVLNSSVGQSIKSYKDHKVVSLRIENEAQLKELQNLELEKGVRNELKRFTEFLYKKCLAVCVP